MKRNAALILPLALLAIACGQTNQGGSAQTSDPSPDVAAAAKPQVLVVRVAEIERLFRL